MLEENNFQLGIIKFQCFYCGTKFRDVTMVIGSQNINDNVETTIIFS